jgi:hypothetical protein
VTTEYESRAVTYRGAKIERKRKSPHNHPQPDEWGWYHMDYIDGSIDGGFGGGWAPTVERCIEAIDEMFEQLGTP